MRVTFELPATLWADEIAVVGEFNDWDPSAHRLARDPDGVWRLTLLLDGHRRFQFRYLVDGAHWANEPFADGLVPSRSGGYNSIVAT